MDQAKKRLWELELEQELLVKEGKWRAERVAFGDKSGGPAVLNNEDLKREVREVVKKARERGNVSENWWDGVLLVFWSVLS